MLVNEKQIVARYETATKKDGTTYDFLSLGDYIDGEYVELTKLFLGNESNVLRAMAKLLKIVPKENN